MKYLVALIVSLLLAANANAVSILIESTSTVGVLHSQTVTLSVLTEPGESFRGFDATFTGPLGQVNPLGFDTFFNDFNPFFFPNDVSQDSQFLFNSTDVLSIGMAEGPNLLTGAVSGLAALSLPNPAPFVQLVLNEHSEFGPLGCDILFDVRIDNGIGQGESFQGRLGEFMHLGGYDVCVPEPYSLALVGVVLVGGVSLRNRGLRMVVAHR